MQHLDVAASRPVKEANELPLEGTLGGRPRPPDFGDHPNAAVVVADPGSRLRLAAGLPDEVDPAVGTYGLRRPPTATPPSSACDEQVMHETSDRSAPTAASPESSLVSVVVELPRLDSNQ
jgi:hypothetical protein